MVKILRDYADFEDKLLSLLNNNDLLEVQEFVESTYKIKADRRNLEILFLKVIPLLSINPRVFLKALIPATESFPLSGDRDEDHSHIWNLFIKRILRDGYLLPGTVNDLGRECLSWLYKWPEAGLKSTAVFSNLQYGGRLRAMNDIPPIEINPGRASLKKITVVMTDLAQYTIDATDLENIICLNPGTYPVREAGASHLNHDLIIEEYEIDGDLHEAIGRTNSIIQEVNTWPASMNLRGNVRSQLRGKGRNEPLSFTEYKGSGRFTRNVAILNDVKMAVAYKVKGRKTSRTDVIRSMARDISALGILIKSVEARSNTTNNKAVAQDRDALKDALDEANNQMQLANQSRVNLNAVDDIPEEPIAQCLYPERGVGKEPAVWNDYRAYCEESHGLLHIEGKVSSVNNVNWLNDDIIELSLNQQLAKVYATPLKPVEEAYRDDEVRIGDTAILVGKYIILAETDGFSSDPGAGYIMTNYLRVTAVDEEQRSRRGANRRQTTESRLTCTFR